MKNSVDEARDNKRARRRGQVGRSFEIAHGSCHILRQPVLFEEEEGPSVVDESRHQ